MEKKKRSYYSKSLDELERIELRNAAAVEGIDEEIALIRFKLKKLISMEKGDPEAIARYINSLCRALITSKAIDSQNTHQLRNALSKLINELLLPLGLDIAKTAIGKRL